MVSNDARKKMLAKKRKDTKKRAKQTKLDLVNRLRQKQIQRNVPRKINEVEVDYVLPDLPFSEGDPKYESLKAVFEHFQKQDGGEESDGGGGGSDSDDKAKRPRRKEPVRRPEVEDDSDEEEKKNEKGLSRRQKRLKNRMSVAKLKTLVKRPDVVEACDTTGPNPQLLVYLKAYRNTVPVPRHWSSKRRYLAGKRGVEKPPFKLPEYIEATGIAKIRQAIVERDAERSRKAASRLKLQPKMGKLDIDYQVLHDAFFKYATKPKFTKHNELYYEGKEFELKMDHKKPGQLSAALKEALAMPDEYPPPWLFNMQRYGPPPSYPTLKIPGLNAPIPGDCEYGFHTGGWGKPPVDEFGNPLYGTTDPNEAEPVYDNEPFWGEVEEADSEEEEDDKQDGQATPVMGTATPVMGNITPIATSGIASIAGTHSISGVSSVTSGIDTSALGTRTGGVASISGVSSASLTPSGPQLFKVLEEQKKRSGQGMFPSNRGYKMGGAATPMGIATPGIATPGIATPMGGIATPMGGIATPMGGMATPTGGIITPMGISHTPVAGMDTPAGHTTPKEVEAEGALTADIIRQQLRQHEEQAKKAQTKAGLKDASKKKEKKKTNKTSAKFKF